MKTEYPWKEEAIIGMTDPSGDAPTPRLVVSGPELGHPKLIEVYFGDETEPSAVFKYPNPMLTEGEGGIPAMRKINTVIIGMAAIAGPAIVRHLAMLGGAIRTGNSEGIMKSIGEIQRYAHDADRSILGSLKAETDNTNTQSA